MLNASRIMLFAISMLLSAASFADDAKSPDSNSEPLLDVTFYVDVLLVDWRDASRRQLIYAVEAVAYSDSWPRPIDEFDFRFRDGSTLARISKLRNLSLLTLAEIGQVRLYLGVNEDGLVGLHFNDFLRVDDESYLEVVRMPYLGEGELDSQFEQLGPDSN